MCIQTRAEPDTVEIHSTSSFKAHSPRQLCHGSRYQHICSQTSCSATTFRGPLRTVLMFAQNWKRKGLLPLTKSRYRPLKLGWTSNTLAKLLNRTQELLAIERITQLTILFSNLVNGAGLEPDATFRSRAALRGSTMTVASKRDRCCDTMSSLSMSRRPS